jgi:transcriptional regulator
MLAAIVGIEIVITDLSGKWKTSQNQPEINRAGVVAGLRRQGTDDALQMAELVAGIAAR